MRAYHDEIVENVISYIAKEYHSHHKTEYIPQTMLYKILALFDFRCLREFGRPCTELSYIAMQKGPVPEELYTNRHNLKSNKYRTQEQEIDGQTHIRFISSDTPDLDYISPKEKQKLDEAIFILTDTSIRTAMASEASHQEIRAWRETYKTHPNSRIDYGLEFARIYDKSDEELSTIEERYLTYKCLSNA